MSDWQVPVELPDLRNVGLVALDIETRDDGLTAKKGSAWPWKGGHVCGISVAYHNDGAIHSYYFPINHPETNNFDRAQIFRWLSDLVASNVRFVTHNGIYDWGWLRTEATITMPPSARMEDTIALATIVDENRLKYSLDALCAWRGLPGKDETLLMEAAQSFSIKPKEIKSHLWELPARFVGPYAETDAVRTLQLFEDLDPVLDQESTRAAYRLEVDLLPMVLEMRRRGVRVDQDAAEQARDQILAKRDAVLAEMAAQHGSAIDIGNINSPKWMVGQCDAYKIKYPRTAKGNPSFKAGRRGWMDRHEHWLPRLASKASKYHRMATVFLGGHILSRLVNGRIFADIHPHKSEDGGGTVSTRFSYSDPPLQQMPKHDEELAPLIRRVFLPEDGEIWLTADASQQEYRLLVHYAEEHNLTGAQEAAERYRTNPETDFHVLVAEIIRRDRKMSKGVNFGKLYGMGPKSLALTLGVSVAEAAAIIAHYDQKLPFAKQMAGVCERQVRRHSHLKLYDGARRHWPMQAVGAEPWEPCREAEARARTADPAHPWHRRKLFHAEPYYKALNALIQGSAARHTKLWMRTCWQEGIVPLLQMHDALECSITSPEQAEKIARLGSEAVSLHVPMLIDLHYGPTWGDAVRTWEQLNNGHADSNGASETNDPIPTDAAEPETRDTRTADRPPEPENSPNHGHSHDDGDGKEYERRKRAGGRLEANFFYPWPSGEAYLKVVKMRLPDGDKYFYQQHRENGRWVNGAPKGPKIPYRAKELLGTPASVPIRIMAGEKDSETVLGLGLPATTNPGGEIKGAWTSDLNHWFGGRSVIIYEDNDDTGRAHTLEVGTALNGHACDIRVVRLPGLPAKGDVSDWVKKLGHTKEELLDQEKLAPKFEAEAPRLSFLDMSKWDSEPEPVREWAVANRVPLRQVFLVSGEGGAGKSMIILHLCAAHTLRRDWLGVDPDPGPGFFIDCEDDDKELRIRAADIVKYHYGMQFADAINGGLHLASWAGCDAVLATFTRSGKIEPTPLYRRLLEAAGDIKPKMIGIASSANVFAGNENDRGQVQQFAGLLTRVAIVANGSIALVSHPSLTGINTDSGISGSTQWHNAVRARAYLKSIKPEAGEQPDTDLREIVFKKNQYGPISASIVLRWQGGMFLPVPEMSSLDQAEAEAKAERVFLELLRRFTQENRSVSDKIGTNYAPALFAREIEAKQSGVNSKMLAAAMRNLFRNGTIWNQPCGRPSRPSYRIAIK
jgi:DNA polymerase I-like protein with 3'-5' exonuclease and polymerase domains/RecA-family ATPase